MSDVALFEAKNRLSELIHRVQAGEEIAITRRGKVVAMLVAPAPEDAALRARQAIAQLQQVRTGVSLGPLKSRALIEEGRR
jgi:prevent-host-death family protein